jgi:hypothetical protein
MWYKLRVRGEGQASCECSTPHPRPLSPEYRGEGSRSCGATDGGRRRPQADLAYSRKPHRPALVVKYRRFRQALPRALILIAQTTSERAGHVAA